MLAAASAAQPSSPTGLHAPRPRHWGRWLLGTLGLLLGTGLLALLLALDPWLRRTLEQQVATQTHGQYRLQIGDLRTRLWQRAIRLRGLRLRPAPTVADTLPRVRLDVARLHITGVGLWTLLRKGIVPIDSVVLDSTRIEVLALAKKPGTKSSKPLHERLPLRIRGLDIGYLGLLHTRVNYRPGAQPTARFRRADLSARSLLISPAGAADTQRLAYAAAWSLRLLRTQAMVAGHRVALGRGQFSTAARRLQLDFLRIRPLGPGPAGLARLDLALPHLRLIGLNALALRYQRSFRADSLLIAGPRLVLTPAVPTPAKNTQTLADYLQALDLAHLAVRGGYLRVAGTAQAPVIRGINVVAISIRARAAGAPDTRRIFFARAWTVALGPSRATVAAHALALTSLRLSTTAGTLDLRAVRIRPPAPGQGPPGGVRVDLRLPSLALTGLDARALQYQRRFRAASLVLDRPRLHFTPPAQPPPPVWKLLAGAVRRSDLALLQVRHAELGIGGMRHAPEVHDLNLTGRALRIDSLAAREPARIAYARAWHAQCGILAAPFDPPYYRATSQRARLDTETKTLRFDDLALTPKYPAVQMNQRKGYQAAAINIRVASLAAQGLDFAALVRRRDVRVARLVVQRPVVRISSDGRGPINPNQSKISPEEMRQLPVVVDVRRLDLVGGNLYSCYRSPLTPVPGTISITRFNGTFRNLSNDPRRQTPATPLTGQASTYLQNQCRLDAQVSMYLLDPQGRHRVWGRFGPGQFAILNAMTEPTRLVSFKSGTIRQLRFDLRADRRQVKGTMWADYSGLQLTLLSYRERTEEIKKTLFSRLKSKAVNVLVIRDQNPRKRGTLVTGEMTSTREPRFSVFTLWRQGMVSGLFHSMGVPQKLAQNLSENKDEAPLPK